MFDSNMHLGREKHLLSVFHENMSLKSSTSFLTLFRQREILDAYF